MLGLQATLFWYIFTATELVHLYLPKQFNEEEICPSFC